jgi:hypothetical protein
MALKKDDKVNIAIVVVAGFVIFNLVPFDKIFEFMSKSTTHYLFAVLIAAIISVPGFIYAKKIINKFEKNRWDK